MNIKSILYLSGSTSPDYLRCITLHGFKQLLHNCCHDYPRVSHIYRDDPINNQTYTNLLERSYHDKNKNNVIEDIINNKYDLVIYGSLHRGMPYFDLVKEYYSKNKIILLCGEDLHGCDTNIHNMYANNGYKVFVREL